MDSSEREPQEWSCPHLPHVPRGDPVDVLDNLTHFVPCEWPPFLKVERMTNPSLLAGLRERSVDPSVCAPGKSAPGSAAGLVGTTEVSLRQWEEC